MSEPITLRITKVYDNTTQSNKPYKTIQDTNGKRYNSFQDHDKWPLLGANVEITAQVEYKGNFANLSQIELVQPPEADHPMSEKRHNSRDEDAMNMRTAVMQILECFRTEKLSKNDILVHQALYKCGEWMGTDKRQLEGWDLGMEMEESEGQ